MNKKEQYAVDFAKYILARGVFRATSPTDITEMPLSRETKLKIGELIINRELLIRDFNQFYYENNR